MPTPRMIVDPTVRGKRGPQGLPGVEAAAWTSGELYSVGTIIQAPDGSWLQALNEHEAGLVFDDNEILNWTPVDASESTIAGTTLRQTFADKSAQNEIESGRLNDAVLSGRFQRHYEWVGAEKMIAATGSPTFNVSGGYTPVVRFDAASDESAAFSIKVHRSWAAFNVIVRGMNLGAGTGSVFLRVLHAPTADGEDVTASSSGGFKALEVVGQNIQQSATFMFNVEADASSNHVFRIFRDADDALDTLGNDWGLLGVELQATSFVEFLPELPEEQENLAGRTFTAADSAALDVRVFHQSPPPVDDTDDEGYKSFPMTDAATLQDFTTSAWSGNKWAFVWANRWNYGPAWNKRPNYVWGPSYRVGDFECRTVFTTLYRAHEATRLQIRHLCGGSRAAANADWIATTSSDGGETVGTADDIFDEADAKADLAAHFTEDFTWAGVTYKVAVDKVILSTARLVDGPDPDTNLGVVLDYEVGDSRSEQETSGFMDAYANVLHDVGKQLFLYTNPLTNIVQKYHGLSATNLGTEILPIIDYIGVMLTSRLAIEGSVPGAYNAALTKLGGISGDEWDKICIVLELGVNPGTTLDDAQWVYDKLHEGGDEHPTTLMFWRFWAQLGGDANRLTNQKISTACFGTPYPPSMVEGGP